MKTRFCVLFAIGVVLMTYVGVHAAHKEEYNMTEPWVFVTTNEAVRDLAYRYNSHTWNGQLLFAEDGSHFASVDERTGIIWLDNQSTGLSVDTKYRWGEFLGRVGRTTYLRNYQSGRVEVYTSGRLIDTYDSIDLTAEPASRELPLGDEHLFNILQQAYFDGSWDGSNIEVSSLPDGWTRGNGYAGIYARVSTNNLVYLNNRPTFDLSAEKAWLITDATLWYDVESPVMMSYAQGFYVLDKDEIVYSVLNGDIGNRLDVVRYRAKLPADGSAELLKAYPGGVVVFVTDSKFYHDEMDAPGVMRTTKSVYQTNPDGTITLLAEDVNLVWPDETSFGTLCVIYMSGEISELAVNID